MTIEELLSLKGMWSTLFMTYLVFGFAPGAILRLIVLMLPKTDVRRQELVGELYEISRWQRPVWVFQQLETCLFEGIHLRYLALRERKSAKKIAPLQTYMEVRKAASRRFDRTFLVFTSTGVTVPLFSMVSALNPFAVHATLIGMVIMAVTGIRARLLYLLATGRSIDRRDFPPPADDLGS